MFQRRIELASKAGTVKRLHVDKHVIAANHKYGRNDPPITVQTSAGPLKTHEVLVTGASAFVYRELQPLSCGARLWIETRSPLVAVWANEQEQEVE